MSAGEIGTPPPDAAVGCVVCGAEAPRDRYPVRDLLWGAEGRWRFVTCTACGHGYLLPRPDGPALARFYAELWSPENLDAMERVGRSPFETALARRRLQAIQRLLGGRTPRRIVDVGCGLGFFLAAARGRWPGAEILGVEVAGPAADRAEARGGTVVRAAFEAAPLAEDSADVVTLCHFLEHQPDPGADLARAARLLAPGGVLAVEVPRLDGWGRRLLRRWYWPHLPPQHLQVFSRGGLLRLLEDRGFGEPVVVRTSGYPFLLTTTLVLFSRFTFGSGSPHARRPWVRWPLALLGWLLLPLVLLLDLTLVPLLNRLGAGDILLVAATRRG